MPKETNYVKDPTNLPSKKFPINYKYFLLFINLPSHLLFINYGDNTSDLIKK